jgi:hypothetical protein
MPDPAVLLGLSARDLAIKRIAAALSRACAGRTLVFSSFGLDADAAQENVEKLLPQS